ncbi:hypothetical protein PMAA_042860 [Talaromyces marneffei ATCC 18224]|uniref:Uncharacterized protein n=1 Tax=Talaromyces marneffei (strain ATCC 18224 / CBS 334.59 / QM 7333) TaxID=441960 RepID=B6QR42_TALMQ|nr:hypothetical protein PMAA_042860 [Talaromyces marneffei ATCC 18224]
MTKGIQPLSKKAECKRDVKPIQGYVQAHVIRTTGQVTHTTSQKALATTSIRVMPSMSYLRASSTDQLKQGRTEY